MLIRSQERNILTSIENMDGLCIVKQTVKDGVKETFDEGHVKIIAITAKMDWTLGEYSSDEKARAVFDMMEGLYQKEDNLVFKMPQDSEIALGSDKPR